MMCLACAAFDAAERHAIADRDGDLPAHTLDGCTCGDRAPARKPAVPREEWPHEFYAKMKPWKYPPRDDGAPGAP
jgi:hypothetical protein